MAYLRLSILFSMLFAASCVGAARKNVFIFAGQSNMAGRGGVEQNSQGQWVWDGIIPPESQPNPSIFRLNPARKWEEAREPLHRDIDINKTVGVSSGISFAHRLLERIGSRAGVIGLVPYARGGTPISMWLKNPANPSATYYNELLTRIRAAENEFGLNRALFWFQGETDAANYDTAVSYKEKLQKLITDLRNDLNPRFLPVYIVKIASYDTYIKHDTHFIMGVRMGEEEVHQELRDVQVIDALGLVNADGKGFNKDRVHLNRQSQVTLGQKMADAYLSQYGRML